MNKTIFITVALFIIIVGGIYLVKNVNQSQAPAEMPNSLAPVSDEDSVPVPTAPVVNQVAPITNQTPKVNSEPTPTPTPTPAVTAIPANHNITIKNFAFSPSSISIKKGDTVIWTNKDSAPHTATGNSGGPDSPTLSLDQTYSFTFNDVGTLSYFCKFHPSMKGTVIVSQ